MGGVPSVPRDRSRKVQVICAGYARTGTSTMALAVEQLLDGPFLHGGTQVLNREDGMGFSCLLTCLPDLTPILTCHIAFTFILALYSYVLPLSC